MSTDYLEQLIIRLATQYDQGEECADFNNTPVSDEEYDALVSELKKLKPNSKVFSTPSPSTYKPKDEGRGTVKHNPPMTSIQKADGDLEKKKQIHSKWTKDCISSLGYKIEEQDKSPLFAMSYKHDGVAIRIYYENGKLAKAGLRSRTGLDGIDVTENVKYVSGIPQQLPLPLTLAIGGELECLLDDFEKVNEELLCRDEEPHKNPRNHTYGAINQQKDPSKTKEGRVSFIAYNITGFDDYQKYYKTEIERYNWCRQVLKINFVPIRPHRLNDETYEKLQRWEDDVPTCPYEVDGVVIKVNDLEDQEQLGHVGDDPTGDPKGAIAWKFAEESATPICKEIEWNASRTGNITPVAIFDKGVNLAGTIVNRATCSNLGWLERMGIGPGAKVRVIKAGKIIPKVIEVLEAGSIVEIPKVCPACGSKTKIEYGYGDNKSLRCENEYCIAKQVEKIVFYLQALECKGLGIATVERLVDAGKIKDLSSLYDLSMKDVMEAGFTQREGLLALATIQMISPNNKTDLELLEAIAKSQQKKKKVDAWKFFAALGIEQAGKTIGKKLIDHFGDFSKIMDASIEELLIVDGVGIVTADNIIEYFEENGKMVKKILEKDVELELPKTGNLSGKSFVLSGTLENGKKYWEDVITERGGKIGSSVSKKTDFLVAGENSGLKSEKALSLGVPILTTDELKKML